jgi:hypothetical protein
VELQRARPSRKRGSGESRRLDRHRAGYLNALEAGIIPPERLLKSMLLIALYSVRSERQFCEQLDYNLLFRWFLDMDMVEESFVPTILTHNRDR